MRIIRSAITMIAAVFVLGLVACCGGHDTEVKKTEIINQPTIGQQLNDLDTAYKNGAITKEEYDKIRKSVLEKSTEPQKK